MPATPSHAAVVWPLRRFWPRAPIAPVAIGAMSPDFLYLLQLSTHGRLSQVGHTIPSLFWFCLPASLLVWLVFVRRVRPMLLDWLPPGLRATLGPVSTLPVVIAGILAGAASHVIWDGFTHDYGWAVTRLPALRGFVWPDVFPRLRWYRLLQDSSTILGGLGIVWAAWAWVRSQPREALNDTPERRRRAVRQAGTVLAAGGAAAAGNVLRVGSADVRESLMLAAIGGMVGIALALLMMGWGQTGVKPGSDRGQTPV